MSREALNVRAEGYRPLVGKHELDDDDRVVLALARRLRRVPDAYETFLRIAVKTLMAVELAQENAGRPAEPLVDLTLGNDSQFE